MSFTEKKFYSLSYHNKLKKTAYAVKEWLEKHTNREYAECLLNWLNHQENTGIPIPENNRGWQMVYEKLMQHLNQNPENNCPALFDKPKTENRKKIPATVILEDIRSPHNVGAIIRSGECFGIEKIITTGITPDMNNNKVKRTAMGAEIITHYEKSISAVMENYLRMGYSLYALEKTGKSRNLKKADIKFPCAFILGNEEWGVSEEVLAGCSETLHIELLGNKNSLNVSVAAGILFYQLSQLAQ